MGSLLIRLVFRLKPQEFLSWLGDQPSRKATMSADGGVLRSGPMPVLLREDYRQHWVSTLHALESDVVPESIAESPVAILID
jgi:hypothetical protein